ncbi:MAG: hypothetical protein ACRYG7_21690 [Janthinobacterium lividum]
MSSPTPLLLPELPADPHSYAATGSLRAQHLRLDLTVDFARRTLAGTATWLLAGGPPAEPGELVLDTRGLVLGAVQLGEAADGTAATYHLAPADTVLGQALRIEVPAGTGAVRVSYRTRPEAAALQWLAPAQTAGMHPFLFTQSQAILARTWLPCPTRRACASATRLRWKCWVPSAANCWP